MKEKAIGNYQLEICSNSVASAIEAEKGGATRVEFCQNLENGGTTPSFGQLQLVRKLVSIGIHVLIRPRGGDFLYTETEILEMIADIEICKQLGMDGVVIGMLNADGTVDKVNTLRLVEAARPMDVTFHRAFDRVEDPFRALEDVIDMGIDRILTSGLRNSALAGVSILKELVQQASGRIVIMPGAGVDASNIVHILKETGAVAIHSSAKELHVSEMRFKQVQVNGMDEAQWMSSKEKVHQMVDLLKSL
ncbi:copper homeostasis protein CutC [Sphingobacterium sp. 2149]|uniref:copper homeostasis protein CutC n=1 Tax=Sphingobacterium sp. 2149 TaxID=2817763 RepID=UPI001AE182C2|nr:copper homeostasis protein CutC [Sphingobacterium sp. 2149]MDR6737624.1 copper homeostasis protein [Sphingobacterium sp. 2149]